MNIGQTLFHQALAWITMYRLEIMTIMLAFLVLALFFSGPSHLAHYQRFWYEVHLLVKPELETELFDWVELNRDRYPELLNFRKMVTVTSTGINPRQPMLTFLTKNPNFEQAVVKAQIVAASLRDGLGGDAVVREKVEGRIRDEMIGHDQETPQQVQGTEYYEFHTKIELTNPDEWRRLAEVLAQFKVPLLYNPDSKNPRPVTTYRHYDTDLKTALKKQKELEKTLVDNGFLLLETIREYSKYDTNLMTDKGWFFLDNPKRFKERDEFTQADYHPPDGFGLVQ